MASSRILWARRLGITCVAMTFVLMVVGAWVKANGAGLACPDWPQCYGQWLPPFPSADSAGTWDTDGDGDLDAIGYSHAQVLYEWTHRAVVSLIGIPVLAFALVTVRARELRMSLRVLPTAAVGVLVLQALLGRLTVVTGNPPWATTMHMALAVVWFGIFVTATAIAFVAPKTRRDVSARPSTPHPAFTPSGAVRFAYPGEDVVAPPAEESHAR